MPETFSDEMRETAQDLIDELGKSATLLKVTSTPDPVSGEPIESEPVPVPVKVVLKAYSIYSQGNDLVQLGDLQATVASETLDSCPTAPDRLLIDGEEWSIVRPELVYAAELPVVYRLQIRR